MLGCYGASSDRTRCLATNSANNPNPITNPKPNINPIEIIFGTYNMHPFLKLHSSPKPVLRKEKGRGYGYA